MRTLRTYGLASEPIKRMVLDTLHAENGKENQYIDDTPAGNSSSMAITGFTDQQRLNDAPLIHCAALESSTR